MTTTELQKTDGLAITPHVSPILQMAFAQGVDTEKLKAMMDLQERWEANEARKAFNAAMVRFKSSPLVIAKDKHVKFGQTEYSHTTLAHANEVIIAALSRVGIIHRWEPDQSKGDIAVTCILKHGDGHEERTTLRSTPDNSGAKNAIQAIGSAVTYLERYTLLAATGLASGGNDDDGNPKGMPEEWLLERLDWIRSSADSKELFRVFSEAYKEAAAAKDSAAMSQLIALKDARKGQLK